MAKTFGTVCDGIGCGHLAFNRAGFECAWSAEIEPFPCAVLEYRFPGVRNHGDMTMTAEYVRDGEIVATDVFIGGTPCQAFSVAGKRKGLEDARGNLSLTFCGIADSIDDVRRRDGKPPCVILWENVPGVLSDAGNAFGCFLGELAGSGCELQPAGDGWGNAGCVFGPRRTVAWRVLDSQFFGVAQRRRRVFVVASAGDGFRPEEVLFEREGVRRDSPPCRETREGVAGDAGSGVARGHWDGGDCHPSLCSGTRGTGGIAASNQELFSQRGSGLVPSIHTFDRQSSGEYASSPLASTVSARDYKSATDLAVTYDMRGRGNGDTVNTLCTDHASRPSDYCPVVALQDVRGVDKAQNGRGYNADGTAYTVDAMATQGVCFGGDVARTLSARHDSSPCVDRGQDVVATSTSVRRLTPIECERLQGLPDNWTLITWRGKPASECPDGPRYKGIGNGQTVNVMEWLARRIAERMP